jgi:hypothetical protein
VRMSTFVSLGVWRSLPGLSLVVSLCSDGYQAPVLEFQLHVGIIFQCHETYFTCSFSHANISQRQQYVHQSHHCHVLMSCWVITLTSSLSHRFDFPSPPPLPLYPNIHNNHHLSTLFQQPDPKQETIQQQRTKKETQITHFPKMAPTNLTDNDRKLLAAAWHCFETQPKVSPSPTAATIPPSESTTSPHPTSSQSHSCACGRELRSILIPTSPTNRTSQ